MICEKCGVEWSYVDGSGHGWKRATPIAKFVQVCPLMDDLGFTKEQVIQMKAAEKDIVLEGLE